MADKSEQLAIIYDARLEWPDSLLLRASGEPPKLEWLDCQLLLHIHYLFFFLVLVEAKTTKLFRLEEVGEVVERD